MLYVYRLLAYCSSTQKNRRESFSPWPSSSPSSSSSSSTFSFFYHIFWLLLTLSIMVLLYCTPWPCTIPLKRRSENSYIFFLFGHLHLQFCGISIEQEPDSDSEPMWMCVCCNVAPFFWFYNCVIQSNITKRLIAQFIFLLLLLLSFVRWHENVSVAIFYVLFFLRSFACFVLVCVVCYAKANDGNDDAYRSSRSECTRM